jgi:hypothetical protein
VLPDAQRRPRRLGTLDQVFQITAGAYHHCALRRNGQVWCSGSNSMEEIHSQPVAAPVRCLPRGSCPTSHPRLRSLPASTVRDGNAGTPARSSAPGRFAAGARERPGRKKPRICSYGG